MSTDSVVTAKLVFDAARVAHQLLDAAGLADDPEQAGQCRSTALAIYAAGVNLADKVALDDRDRDGALEVLSALKSRLQDDHHLQ
jgi:hypothetical protein